MSDAQVAELKKADRMLSIGRPPVQIDVTNQITGVDFEDVFADKFVTQIDELEVNFISKADLIKNKRMTGRPKDLLDAEALERGNHRTPG
jgi:hypothetical protein